MFYSIHSKEYTDYMHYLKNSVEMKTWNKVFNEISDNEYEKLCENEESYLFENNKKGYNYLYRFIRKYNIKTSDNEYCTVGHFIDCIEY